MKFICIENLFKKEIIEIINLMENWIITMFERTYVERYGIFQD